MGMADMAGLSNSASDDTTAPNPNDLGALGKLAAGFNGVDSAMAYNRIQALSKLAQQAQSDPTMNPADIYRQADAINANPTDIAQRNAIISALSKSPAGSSPLQQLAGAGQNVAAQTGDTGILSKLPEIMQQISTVNKNNADANLATANTAKAQSETVTSPTGAPLMPGQKDVDKEFSSTYNNFANGGGEKNLHIANNILDQTIQGLQSGTIQTGRLVDRMATDTSGHPTYLGKAIDPQVQNAQARVNTAVLPLLKPLFGSRVTNFDAQSAIQSMGLNPMQDNNTNIQQLQNLKARIAAGHDDLLNSGQYFQKNGTLAGYAGNGGTPMENTPQKQGSQPAPKVATQADVQATMRSSGKSQQEVMQALQAKGYTIQ